MTSDIDFGRFLEAMRSCSFSAEEVANAMRTMARLANPNGNISERKEEKEDLAGVVFIPEEKVRKICQ